VSHQQEQEQKEKDDFNLSSFQQQGKEEKITDKTSLSAIETQSIQIEVIDSKKYVRCQRCACLQPVHHTPAVMSKSNERHPPSIKILTVRINHIKKMYGQDRAAPLIHSEQQELKELESQMQAAEFFRHIPLYRSPNDKNKLLVCGPCFDEEYKTKYNLRK
jgi:hypothetical protein